MDPQYLLDNLYDGDVQNYLSACVQSWLITKDQDLEQIIGLKNKGFSCQNAKTIYFKKKRGTLIYSIYCELKEKYNQKESAQFVFNWINEMRRPWPEYAEEVENIIYYSNLINAKTTNLEAFTRKIYAIDKEIAARALLLA